MDTAQWPQQGIGLVKGSVEGSQQIRQPQIQVERRVRPHKEQSLNCPRCNSTNTKFCYYNNYSLSQPRYFCKTCRRYWTEGGSLRNVPVGGGSRKNKRNSTSSSSHSSSSTAHSSTICSSSSSNSSSIQATSSTIPLPSSTSLLMPKFFQGVHDLNLSFPNQSLGSLSALEMLRTGFVGPSVFGSSGFGFQELMRPAGTSNLKPQTLEGFGGGMDEGGDGRLLFPFEDLKQVSMTNCGSNEGVVNTSINTNTNKYEQGDTTLFWNGIMGGNNGGGEAHGRGGGSW